MKMLKKKVKFILWMINKKGKPPHIVKEKILKYYTNKFKLDTLIETGTYEGEMVWELRKKFKKIFSIELNPILASKAKRKFFNLRNIKIIQGDSTKELGALLRKVSPPCLFWLDAHYSGKGTSKGEKETPIEEELKTIFNHSPKNVILIDDADDFGKGDYLSIGKLKKLVKKGKEIKLKNNVIRIYPSKD